jgi:hypothetical protein
MAVLATLNLAIPNPSPIWLQFTLWVSRKPENNGTVPHLFSGFLLTHRVNCSHIGLGLGMARFNVDVYCDEDGEATEESLRAFSDKWQRIAIALCSIVGFLAAIARVARKPTIEHRAMAILCHLSENARSDSSVASSTSLALLLVALDSIPAIQSIARIARKSRDHEPIQLMKKKKERRTDKEKGQGVISPQL